VTAAEGSHTERALLLQGGGLAGGQHGQAPTAQRVSLERLFLSWGICNQLMFAGDRASHGLAEETRIGQISGPQANPGHRANNPDSADGSWSA